MVIWWHPHSSVLYTSSAARAKLWYGDAYLDHAIICDEDFVYAEWFVWMKVVA